MAAVYQDILLEWKGAEYTIKPSMKLLQDIEQKFSISRVAHRITTGDVPLSHMASIVGIMLRSAGSEVTDDEVFSELMQGDAQVVQDMAIALISAAFPFVGEAQGNALAPKPAAKKAASKK